MQIILPPYRIPIFSATTMAYRDRCRCCVCPNGPLVFIPLLIACTAIVLSLVTVVDCQFVQINDTGKTVGLWAWKNPNYNATAASAYDHHYHCNNNDNECDYCIYFDTNNFVVDSYWSAARALSLVALFLGSLTTLYLWYAVCFPWKSGTACTVGFFFFVASVCQALTFLFLMSKACQPADASNPYRYWVPSVEQCSLREDGKICIAASVFWFVAAIVSGWIRPSSVIEDDHDHVVVPKAVRTVTSTTTTQQQQGGGVDDQHTVATAPPYEDSRGNDNV